MSKCLLGGHSTIEPLLDLAEQPVTNRFLTAPTSKEYVHPLGIGVCRKCGLVQLTELMPVHEVRPRVDWIVYNEPEPSSRSSC